MHKKIGLILFLMIISIVAYAIETGDTIEFLVQSGHSDWVSSVSFSPDGKSLTSGSKDTSIKYWNITTSYSFDT